ncbi:hypothetical protein TrRE_jg13158 [Triparma retinervis]|uniref:Uncharacterized protein n=1 Tax=Triparma retinervis TaxID=2557542 RepID=A0A9W6ZHC4_9STRA|nr:hypothetical protein TrRE_jg13158 [Triparma retinervis]
MKFTLAITLLALAPTQSFITPTPSFTRGTSLNLVEPKGSDAFTALVSEDTGAVRQVRDLPPPLRKLASVATIPLSAAAGYLMTPSRRVVASAVGSVVTGVGGVVAKSKLDNVAEKAARGAVARLLMDKGIDDCSEIDIEQVRVDFGVDEGEWVTIKTRVFRQEDTDEAYNYEMMRVGKVFGLSLSEVPDRVGLVAKPFYDRALMSSRTKIDQVSADMLSRARNSIGIGESTAVAMHLAAYTEEVRELLNLAAASDASSCKLDPTAREKLSKLKGILQIDDLAAQRAVESETVPLYKACVSSVLAGCTDPDVSLSSLVGKLAIRQGDLDLSGEAAEKSLSEAIRAVMNERFAEACQYSRVNNIEGTSKVVRATLEFKDKTMDLLRKISTEIGEEGDANIEATYFKGKLGAYGEGVKERPLIFKQFLTGKLASAGNKLTDADYDELEQVKSVFDIDAMDGTLAFKSVAGPTLKEAMESATSDILDLPRTNDSFREIVDNLRIPEDTVKEFAMDIYRTRIRSAAEGADGGIVSEDQSAGLVSLRDLLDLSATDVRGINTRTLGPAFKASVTEAMGSSGIIPESYLEPLEKLKGRLLLSKEDGESIKNAAFADKLAPMCAELVKTMEKKPEEQKQDAGDLAAKTNEEQFLEDCVDVLGFLRGNNLATKVEDGSEEVTEKKMVKKTEKQMVKKTVKTLKQEPMESGIMRNVEVEEEVEEEEEVEVEVEEDVTSTVPKFRYEYPMTAQTVSGVSDEKASALYKQFVIGSFQAKEPLATKYAEEGDSFGAAMGLDAVEINKIKGGIGATIFDNYFSNAMQDKTEMDQQDFMFLTQIQERLGFSDDIVERLLVSSQKNLLSKEVERLFSTGTKISPAAVAAVVAKASVMEINLNRDLGVDDDRLGRMFGIQVMGGIEDGSITASNGSDALGEIVEGLGMQPEVAERRLDDIVKDRAKRIVTNLASDVARGNDERAMQDIPVFLSYAGFVEGEGLGLKVAANVRDKIVGVYESATFGQEGSAEMVALLRKALS